jgi:hypothetical protein
MTSPRQIAFNKVTKTERIMLNHAQFLDKHVYYNMKTGFYFELNASRLGVWSTAMVCSLFLIF